MGHVIEFSHAGFRLGDPGFRHVREGVVSCFVPGECLFFNLVDEVLVSSADDRKEVDDVSPDRAGDGCQRRHKAVNLVDGEGPAGQPPDHEGGGDPYEVSQQGAFWDQDRHGQP